jgi:type I restriction enzyme, S subunit
MSELPQGWKETELGEVGYWSSGGTPSRRNAGYFGVGIPWIKSGDLHDGPILTTAEQITEVGLKNSSAKLMPSGTISMALYGATIGKLGVMTFPAATNQACANVIPHVELIDPNYLFFYLLSERKALIEKGQGGAQPNISQEIVKAHPVVLAPLNEQHRIVTKLEKLLSRVNAAQGHLAAIPHILKRFRQSVLDAACSGRLTVDWREENPNTDEASSLVAKLEKAHQAAGGHKRGNAAAPTDEVHDLNLTELPSTWRITDLRTAVCPDRPITYGILKPGPETPGGILYVRVADFPNDKLNLSTIRRTTTEIESVFARARLREGDILLSIRGTVGRVCVVPRELKNANITQDTARLSIQPTLDSGFVMWFLRARTTQRRMQKAVKGVAVRGINIGDVRALQLAVPPLAEQQEIIRRVQALFKTVEELEARYCKAKASVDKLSQSILARAFRGELVPQDSNDEPACILLERVRTERALKQNVSKKPKRTASVKPKRSEVIMLKPEEIKHSYLSDILRDRGPLSPEALWNESQLDIDYFYDQLKLEETRGLLKETSNDASKDSRLLEAA